MLMNKIFIFTALPYFLGKFWNHVKEWHYLKDEMHHNSREQWFLPKMKKVKYKLNVHPSTWI